MAATRFHRQLPRLLAAVVKELSDGRVASISVALSQLARQIRLHVRVEEEPLFPKLDLCERKPLASLTTYLREEHGSILDLLGKADDAFAHQDCALTAVSLGQLRVLLRSHHSREERLLYPTADRLLSDASKIEIVARLEAGCPG